MGNHAKLNNNPELPKGNSGAQVNCQLPHAPEIDPIPGLLHSNQKMIIHCNGHGHPIHVMESVKLSPRCHTIVRVTTQISGEVTPLSNNVSVRPRIGPITMCNGRLFLHPGIYVREGRHIKLLITNYGSEAVLLPRNLTIGFSHEGYLSTKRVLKSSYPVQLSPIELSERRTYVIKNLNLSQNILLHGEFKIQEKLIQLFLDHWDVLFIPGGDNSKGNNERTKSKLEADIHPVGPHAPIDEPPREAANVERSEPRGKEYDNNLHISPWAFPLVPCVIGNSRVVRWALDFRKVQGLTAQDEFPLKCPTNGLHQAKGSTVFSCVNNDLTSRTTILDKCYKDTFAPVTRVEAYFTASLPMGPGKHPINYSRRMYMTPSRISSGFALGYVDVTMVHSPTLEDHLTHLGQLLQLHSIFGIKLHLKECHIFQQEVEHLGHLISAEGIRMIPNHVRKILAWPPPTTGLEMENFLDFTEHYRPFIKEYALLTLDMDHARHKVSVTWTKTMKSQFDALKHRFQEGTTRGYPDYDNPEPFIIDTEVSGFNATAVLSQKQGDKEVFLGYVVKTCSQSQRVYSGHTGGLCAVVLGLHRFEQILKRRAFVIRTDRLCCEYLNYMGKWEGMYRRIQTFLSGFDYKVIYRGENPPSDTNTVGNLKVLPGLKDNTGVLDEYPKIVDDRYDTYSNESFTSTEIRRAVHRDSTLTQIKVYVGTQHKPGVKDMEYLTWEGASYAQILDSLSISEGLLYHQAKGKDGSHLDKRICLPSELQEKAFRCGHITDDKEHLGVTYTILRIRETFYFPNIYEYVIKETLKCTTCNPKRTDTLTSPRKVASLRVKPGKGREEVTHFGQQVHLGTLTLAHGPQEFRGLECRSILIIQDGWSNYLHAIPIPKDDTTTLTQNLLESWVYAHGYPETVQSYKGSVHTSGLFFELLSALDIYGDVTPVYSQGEDRCFRSHRILHKFLQTDPSFKLEELPAKLTLAVFAHNSTRSVRGNPSPYEKAFGRSPVLPMDLPLLLHERVGASGSILVLDLREEYHQTIKAFLGRKPTEKDREPTPLSEDTQGDKVYGGKENTPIICITSLDDIDPKGMPHIARPQDI